MIENYFSLPLFMEVNEKYDLFYDEIEKAISSARKNNHRFISRILGGMERETQPQPAGLLDGGFMPPYEKPNFLEFYDLFLKKYIEHCASRYVSESRWSFIKPDTDYEAVVDESWINIDGKGCYQAAHTHPRSIISGTYYHQCDGDEGNLVLYNPIPYIQYGQFPENIYTCGGELPVQIQKGKLVMFPSWLQHRTDCNKTDKERISIAFNISVKEK